MFCKKCGSEIKKEQKFCPKCGNEITAITDDFYNEKNSTTNESVAVIKSRKSNKSLIIISGIILTIVAIAVLVVINLNSSNNMWDDYLKTHQIDESAKDITYYVTGVGGDASDFSYDLSTDRIISSQVCDIDNDGADELLQITIRKDADSIQIFPCLEIVEETDGFYTTESYDFSSAKFYISTLFEGDYYLYKSEKNTYVLIEKDTHGDTGQFCAAGVISINKSHFASYSFTQYDNGTSECYDIYKDERIISTDDTGSAFYITQMSNLRMIFSALGLKGFLTGTDDVDNIKNYNDITLIGKFSVTINGSQGNITYTDLTNESE